ncbi:hypothetical protein N7501_006418, partial [Penicillium viridicatum]
GRYTNNPVKTVRGPKSDAFVLRLQEVATGGCGRLGKSCHFREGGNVKPTSQPDTSYVETGDMYPSSSSYVKDRDTGSQSRSAPGPIKDANSGTILFPHASLTLRITDD